MDLQTLKKVRKPRPYTPIEQVQLGTDTHSGWGEPVKVPKGALKELEANKYASLIQEKYDLQLKLQKVLIEAAEVGGKAAQRNKQYKCMTGRQTNSSKKLKPPVRGSTDLEGP
jgi:hypothetical protein